MSPNLDKQNSKMMKRIHSAAHQVQHRRQDTSQNEFNLEQDLYIRPMNKTESSYSVFQDKLNNNSVGILQKTDYDLSKSSLALFKSAKMYTENPDKSFEKIGIKNSNTLQSDKKKYIYASYFDKKPKLNT